MEITKIFTGTASVVPGECKFEVNMIQAIEHDDLYELEGAVYVFPYHYSDFLEKTKLNKTIRARDYTEVFHSLDKEAVMAWVNEKRDDHRCKLTRWLAEAEASVVKDNTH